MSFKEPVFKILIQLSFVFYIFALMAEIALPNVRFQRFFSLSFLLYGFALYLGLPFIFS